MRRKRFSVEQIVVVLKQVEAGLPVVEVCRQSGITKQPLYRWKKQYLSLQTESRPHRALGGEDAERNRL